MAANPNMIGGGRMTRSEISGDKRRFEGATINRGALLLRLWRYLGKNRVLVVLAVLLSATSSLLSLYGPKLSGEAINAIPVDEVLADGTVLSAVGRVDFDTIFRCVSLMAVFYICAAALTFLLNVVMIRLSRRVSNQMRHDVFENLTRLPVQFLNRGRSNNQPGL